MLQQVEVVVTEACVDKPDLFDDCLFDYLSYLIDCCMLKIGS